MGCSCSPILPTDDPETAWNKKLLIIGSITALVGFSASIVTDPLEPAYYLRRIMLIAGLSAVPMHIVIEKKIRHNVVEAALYCAAVSLLMSDVYLAAKLASRRVWPYFVLLVDICLVCKMLPRVTRNLIVMLVLWFVVTAFENSFRFGLYDLSVLPSQEDRREVIDCDNLPCKQSVSESIIIIIDQCSITLLDFYFTRSFAYNLRKEHAKMNQAIDATERIASSLSRFDLAQAEGIISTASLPPPLHDAFSKILSNLYVYRPYLPQSCFCEEFTDSSESENQPATPKSTRNIDSLESLPSVDNQLKVLERKQCSFTVTNMLGSHREVSKDAIAYQETFRCFMEAVVTSYSHVMGVVGVVVGDHVHASFNAMKRCAGHAKNAVQGAMDLCTLMKSNGINVVTGVASGTAFCGSLGCSELMSVGMIGTPVVVASVLQDLARSDRYEIVCSEAVFKEVSYAFNLRIILNNGKMAESLERSFCYEVLLAGGEKNEKEKKDEEWMYQLEERPWDTYNMAGKQFLKGDAEEALRVLRIKRERPSMVAFAEGKLELSIVSAESSGNGTSHNDCSRAL